MRLLSERTVKESSRLDPTLENYEKALSEFIAEAKANPQKNYLFF
jgi:hypothetical protein